MPENFPGYVVPAGHVSTIEAPSGAKTLVTAIWPGGAPHGDAHCIYDWRDMFRPYAEALSARRWSRFKFWWAWVRTSRAGRAFMQRLAPLATETNCWTWTWKAAQRIKEDRS